MKTINRHPSGQKPDQIFLAFLSLSQVLAEISTIENERTFTGGYSKTLLEKKKEEIETITLECTNSGLDIKKTSDDLLLIMNDQFHKEPFDYLGTIYEKLLLGNKQDQFETLRDMPFTQEQYQTTVDRKGYYTVRDKSCGSGGMAIKILNYLKEQELEPANTLFIQATDERSHYAQMAYIQLSMLGVTAAVTHASTSIIITNFHTYEETRVESQTSKLTSNYYKNKWHLKPGVNEYIPIECYPQFVKNASAHCIKQ